MQIFQAHRRGKRECPVHTAAISASVESAPWRHLSPHADRVMTMFSLEQALLKIGGMIMQQVQQLAAMAGWRWRCRMMIDGWREERIGEERRGDDERAREERRGALERREERR